MPAIRSDAVPWRDWTIRTASRDEAASAVGILRDVATSLMREGRPLWDPGSFDVDDFRKAALRDELVLGYQGAAAVACMLLQRSDPVFWPDDSPGEALYLHKLAVPSQARGVGWSSRLIHWARTRAVENMARFLRLDAPQSRLIALYQKYGFVLVDAEPRWFGKTKALRLEMRIQ